MSQEKSDLLRALQFRNKSMKERYDVVRPSFQDVAQWIDPARGRHLGMGDNADRLKQIQLIDSTPRKAHRIVKAGLMGGLSSPSKPWFKLKARGFERPSGQVQAWLSESQRIIYEILQASNAYSALFQCYGDLSLFGVYAGVVRSSYENVIHVQSMPIGSFLLGADDEGDVDTLHWTIKMTVRNIVERFGMENCSPRVQNMYKANQMNDRVDVRAAIEPRLVKDPMKAYRSDNMDTGVFYWEEGSRDKLLHEGGLTYAGILAPRWETVSDDPWPISSPGRDALGDIRQLQAQQRDRDTAVQMSYKPPLAGPAEGMGFSYIPGAYNVLSMAEMAKGMPQPMLSVTPQIQHLDMGIQNTQGRVFEAFYADLFRMASEYGIEGVKNVTATAIASLQEEKLIVLGPVLESLDRGLLSPLIKAAFHYAQEAEIIPPAPDDLVGAEVDVEFVSLLAQAQRAIGVASMERTIGFAGTLAQMGMPGVMQTFDGDGLVREFADQVGFPMDRFRPEEDVAAEREQQAQQAQAQMMAEQAPALAGAANLISEANVRGQETLAAQGLV